MTSSSNAPYATVHDAPKFEKRAGVVGAPWLKEQAAVKNVRGQDPLPYRTCNSRNAPFATLHNVPKPSEQSALLHGPYVEQPVHPSPQVPLERKISTPYGTSDDVVQPRTKPNLSKVHQAPWDRSDRKLDHHPAQGVYVSMKLRQETREFYFDDSVSRTYRSPIKHRGTVKMYTICTRFTQGLLVGKAHPITPHPMHLMQQTPNEDKEIYA